MYGATWQFKNWTAAVQACKDKGLQIAFPRNKAENAQLLHDIKASFTTHPNARKYSHENWVSESFKCLFVFLRPIFDSLISLKFKVKSLNLKEINFTFLF